MTPHEQLLRLVHTGLLRTASILVPRTARAEWLSEWRSELWHVRQSADVARRAREGIAFCLGAFPDALCLRRLAQQDRTPIPPFHGSAAQCLLALSAVLAASYALSLLLPGVNAESHASKYQISPDVILIQGSSSSDDTVPTISAEEFRAWKQRRQRYFDNFAFYRIASNQPVTAVNSGVHWKIAHASPNLFTLLGLEEQLSLPRVGADEKTPALVLSERIWRRDFHANPEIVGTAIRVDNRTVRVAGIMPFGTWRLPGDADVWLLEPDSENAGKGFALAHLTRLGTSAMLGDRVPITSNNSDDSNDYWGETFRERTRGPQRKLLVHVVSRRAGSARGHVSFTARVQLLHA